MAHVKNVLEAVTPAKQKSETIPLSKLVEELNKFDSPVKLAVLQDLLRRLEMEDDELHHFQNFSNTSYQRNRVACGEHFEALLLCFRPGQRTPVHDHAGSACGVKVIDGVASETVFESTENGWLYPTQTNHLAAPGVVGSVDMDIHQLGNLQTDGQDLTTLHIYSPPLGEVGNYRLEDNSKVIVTAPTRSAGS